MATEKVIWKGDIREMLAHEPEVIAKVREVKAETPKRPKE